MYYLYENTSRGTGGISCILKAIESPGWHILVCELQKKNELMISISLGPWHKALHLFAPVYLYIAKTLLYFTSGILPCALHYSSKICSQAGNYD
jgi:hypothetical protein